MLAIKIPADTSEPIGFIDVDGNNWRAVASAIGGGCEYIEPFLTPLTAGYGLVGVADENGQFGDQPPNPRSWPLYPVQNYTLRGNVLVMYEDDDSGDFHSVPEEYLSVVKHLLRAS